MSPMVQEAGRQAPTAPIDADRLAQKIEEGVEKALEAGLAGVDQQASAREQLRDAIDQIRDEVAQARLQGRGGSLVPQQFVPEIPREAVDITVALFTTIAFIIVGLPLARAFARRMDRRGQAAPASELAPRLDRIEQAVDAIAVEVERISENQRYSTKVISELRGIPAPNPVGGWQPGREAAPVQRDAAESRRP